MKVSKIPGEPVPPPDTYDITGLTREEAEFLRDLTGRFADNPGDNGIARHAHTTLFAKLAEALGYGEKKFRFYVTREGLPRWDDPVLHCRRAQEDE